MKKQAKLLKIKAIAAQRKLKRTTGMRNLKIAKAKAVSAHAAYASACRTGKRRTKAVVAPESITILGCKIEVIRAFDGALEFVGVIPQAKRAAVNAALISMFQFETFETTSTFNEKHLEETITNVRNAVA